MDKILFFDVCLSLLFLGLGMLCSVYPLINTTATNKRGFIYYFCSGGLLAFTLNFFRELEPSGLDIPIQYASNFLSVLGFLLVLALTTFFATDSAKPEYTPIEVEDGSVDIDIDEIELMISDSRRNTFNRHIIPKDFNFSEDKKEKQYNAFSDTNTDKFIVSLSALFVMSYLNFFIGFWFSCEEHNGYKKLIVAIFNQCLLAGSLSSLIVGLYRLQLPKLFWPFITFLSCSAPLGIIVGSQYGRNAETENPDTLDPYMHTHLKILIHLGLCLCRGLLLYVSTICMISHAIVNKNYNRANDVVAVLLGSIIFSVMNEV